MSEIAQTCNSWIVIMTVLYMPNVSRTYI